MEEESQIIQEISSLSQEDSVQFLKEAYLLVAKWYDEEQDEPCIEGSQYLLNSYAISPFPRMKLYAIISMTSDDWYIAEQYRKRAGLLYTTEVNRLFVGTDLDADYTTIRRGLDELTQSNEPVEYGERESPQIELQHLAMPSLEAIAATSSTQEELQHAQYTIEELDDADELYYEDELAAYKDALQRILDRGDVPPLVALGLRIPISSLASDQTWAEFNFMVAEEMWIEQRSKWDAQIPPDLDSFMQATRHALNVFCKKHDDAAAAEVEKA